MLSVKIDVLLLYLSTSSYSQIVDSMMMPRNYMNKFVTIRVNFKVTPYPLTNIPLKILT